MKTTLGLLLALLLSSCVRCEPCSNGTVPTADKMGACNCPPAPAPTPAPTPTPPKPAPVVVAPSCSTACVHFRELSCPEGNPTNDGASCETVCSNMQSTGMIVYDLACATKVKTCAAIAQCPRQ